MQKAHNQILNVTAKLTRIFLKNGYLEKQMKEQNPSLENRNKIWFFCHLSTSRLINPAIVIL